MPVIEQIAKERELLNDIIRSFFCERGYTEVETPLLVQSPDMEPNLQPFETELKNEQGRVFPMCLITSPEFSMKKLLGRGMEKIFTITKVFRNGEDMGVLHNPEFSLLEWYRQNADYHACMKETEALVQAVFEGFGKTLPKFSRERLEDLFAKFSPAPLSEMKDSDQFFKAFLTDIEPNLQGAVFVYNYPVYQAALARLSQDKRHAERFELYLNGLELCNGFTELTNANEQRLRFERERQTREEQGKALFSIDEELLQLLPSIRNPTYGNALGIDRLHMAVTGRTCITDVLLFPASKLFT